MIVSSRSGAPPSELCPGSLQSNRPPFPRRCVRVTTGGERARSLSAAGCDTPSAAAAPPPSEYEPCETRREQRPRDDLVAAEPVRRLVLDPPAELVAAPREE